MTENKKYRLFIARRFFTSTWSHSNGGSCICGPDGEYLVTPNTSDLDTLVTAVVDMDRVREERQNFDPVGHYSRPDVTRLTVNRERQATAEFKD